MHSKGIPMVCTRKLKYEKSGGPTLYMRIASPLSGLSGEEINAVLRKALLWSMAFGFCVSLIYGHWLAFGNRNLSRGWFLFLNELKSISAKTLTHYFSLAWIKSCLIY